MGKLEQEIAKIRNKSETPLKDWLKKSKDFLNNSDSNEEVLMYFSYVKDIYYTIIISGIFVKDDKTANFCHSGPFVQEYSWTVVGQRESVRPAFGDNENNFEPFCFIKCFDGRTEAEGKKYVEIYQKVTHLLDLHFVPHKNAYCLHDDLGDLIEVIKIHLIDEYNYITIKRKYLNFYLRLNNLTLVKLFECTRIDRIDEFSKWNLDKEQFIKENGIDARAVIQGNAAFIIGHKIVEKHVSPLHIYEELSPKKYETFKIYNRRDKNIIDCSCDPKGLSNYFNMKDNKLPHELSTVFFKLEVLSKYRNNPDKYTVTERSIFCKNAWSLKPYGINDDLLVHTFLVCLSWLPYKEQQYWKSYNVEPHDYGILGGISKEFHKTYILGEFRTEESMQERVCQLLDKMKSSGIWTIQEWFALNTWIEDNSKQWTDEIGNIYNIFINSIKENDLKAILKQNFEIQDKDVKNLRGINLLKKMLECKKLDVDKISILYEIKDIRNLGFAHKNEAELKAKIDNVKVKYGSLKGHYNSIIIRLMACVEFLLKNLQCEKFLAKIAH